jgi:hypothetical protein
MAHKDKGKEKKDALTEELEEEQPQEVALEPVAEPAQKPPEVEVMTIESGGKFTYQGKTYRKAIVPAMSIIGTDENGLRIYFDPLTRVEKEA